MQDDMSKTSATIRVFRGRFPGYEDHVWQMLGVLPVAGEERLPQIAVALCLFACGLAEDGDAVGRVLVLVHLTVFDEPQAGAAALVVEDVVHQYGRMVRGRRQRRRRRCDVQPRMGRTSAKTDGHN